MSDQDDELAALTRRFEDWLNQQALPLWWEKGADHVHGGFLDTLNQDASPAGTQHRARVQARQSWTYGVAGEMGWDGPWREAAVQGLRFLTDHHLRPDGQFSTRTASDGTVLDKAAFLYDQTFILLALAQLQKVLAAQNDWAGRALVLLGAQTTARRHIHGGFTESGDQPFQSNPIMHLFEAALAWCEVSQDSIWHQLADHLAELCLTHLIDPDKNAIAEYFDADWRPLPQEGEQHLSPGHQFEWAWLLGRWSKMRRHMGAREVAGQLFETGTRGVDLSRQIAVHEMSLDFEILQPTARLWAQAERIKAAVLLAGEAHGTARERYQADAIKAANSLWRYMQTPVPGLWRDRMMVNGNFIGEPAPASSFYHIICCIAVLKAGIRQ